jgi:hypothetical protein
MRRTANALLAIAAYCAVATATAAEADIQIVVPPPMPDLPCAAPEACQPPSVDYCPWPQIEVPRVGCVDPTCPIVTCIVVKKPGPFVIHVPGQLGPDQLVPLLA